MPPNSTYYMIFNTIKHINKKLKEREHPIKKPIKKRQPKNRKSRKEKKEIIIIIIKNSINIEEYELRWTKIVIHYNLFIRGFYFYKIKTFLVI